MESVLDVILRRNFKTSKFKNLAKLAITRTSILKNQKQVRYSQAKSDVIELLNLGHQERALLRVEHMIKEQNLMDAFALIEEYCYLLIDRFMFLKKEKECHEEVKEAIASLIFASSRCGEFPELQQIRGIIVSRFGKELASRAVELRNNCGVNPKIIQKLSVRRPSLDVRLKVLKETASEVGVILNLEEENPVVSEKKFDGDLKQKKVETDESKLVDEKLALIKVLTSDEKSSESLKTRKKYRDVAAAALEAFESAAYAAAAARAVVELALSKSLESNEDGQVDSVNQFNGAVIPYEHLETAKESDNLFVYEKIDPVDYPSSESEGEDSEENEDEMHVKDLEDKPCTDIFVSTLSADSNGSTPSLIKQDSPCTDIIMSTFSTDSNESISSPVQQDQESNATSILPENETKNNAESNAEDNFNLASTEKTESVEKPHSEHRKVYGKALSMKTRSEQRD